MDQLIKEFLAESQEGLERMERCLTDLELRPDDRELVAEIFRAVHTIKGSTGFLGYARLETLAHAGENLLGALRDGKLTVSSALISGLLELMDGLRAILQLIEKTGGEGQRSRDNDSRLLDLLASLGRQTGDAVAQDKDTQAHPEEVFAPTETSPIQVRAAAPAALPTLPAPVSPEPAREPSPQTVSSQIVSPQTTSAPTAAPASEKTLRIDVEVLDRMMNLVGELVLTRNQILQSQLHAENFPELARRLDTVTADLRSVVMQARMQPVEHLFSKFPRMVRDLALLCGRSVRIEFEGQETGLDKSLLEAIKDPLTHAVRNSVDHGIEAPEIRVQNGKPAEGLIRLRAFHQNGSVVIEISDDGAGISRAKVLAKALERGLITPEHAASMTEREALQLIFLPGFSTAAAVTHISGRGVGMDVVRANVEKVGGTCEIQSREGQGTTLRLRVPLTLAIIPALIVRSGDQSFALPQNSLMELVYVSAAETPDAIERIGTAELYRLRGRLLPLLWLDRVMGLETASPAEPHGFYIAVLEAEGCRFGLVVDDLLAPEEIVVKPLTSVLREIGLFFGATILGNGVLAMILDVAAMGDRVGMRPTAESPRILATGASVSTPEPAQVTLQNSLVIYEIANPLRPGTARERMAMPLSAVERIESVPVRNIEYAAGRPVLQYRGELLPLEDDGGMLAASRETGIAAAIDDSRTATVLICRKQGSRGLQRIGYVVQRVLDVSAGTMLPLDTDAASSSGSGLLQIAMVKERVTTVHRQFPFTAVAATSTPIFREVA